jgi:hypothetical protein
MRMIFVDLIFESCVVLDPAGFFLSKKHPASGSACIGTDPNLSNYDTGTVSMPILFVA